MFWILIGYFLVYFVGAAIYLGYQALSRPIESWELGFTFLMIPIAWLLLGGFELMLTMDEKSTDAINRKLKTGRLCRKRLVLAGATLGCIVAVLVAALMYLFPWDTSAAGAITSGILILASPIALVVYYGFPDKTRGDGGLRDSTHR